MRVIREQTVLVDVIGLVLSVLVVRVVYVLFIDPAAADAMLIAAQTGEPPERTFVIIVKDLEQELCVILTIWCLWLWSSRYRLFMDETYWITGDFLNLGTLEKTVPSTDRDLDYVDEQIRKLSDTRKRSPLIYPIELAVKRMQLNGSFKEATEVAMEACDLHLELLNSKLSITKYILWAIPSIGFLGTVRGIGEALGQAGEAMAGDISGVASSLGVAFNSTFVALFLSLLLMFLSNTLQGREERLVASLKQFVSTNFIPLLSERSSKRLIADDVAQVE